MALSPKESGEFIARSAKHVLVKDAGVENLAQKVLKELEAENIRISSICDHECYPHGVSTEAAINWILTLDTVNFCFWTQGPGKWEIHYKDKNYTGYFALCAAVARAIDEGVDMTDPAVYSKFTLEELANIFRSETKKEIPLLKERLDCLHQVGKILLDKYDGSFTNCIKKCNKSAQALLNLVTSEFECFNDVATYNGKQESPDFGGDIWSQFKGEGYGEFKDIETITMFADYRVPQPLVHFKAMEYDEEILRVLNTGNILESGCEYEVEIRGCSIEVIERVKRRVDQLMVEQGKSIFAILS